MTPLLPDQAEEWQCALQQCAKADPDGSYVLQSAITRASLPEALRDTDPSYFIGLLVRVV